MQLREKSKLGLLLLSVLIALCVFMTDISPAFAQVVAYPGTLANLFRGDPVPVCASYVDPVSGAVIPLTGLTARFVNCILGTVSWTVQSYLVIFGNAFVSTVNAMAVLATIFYGFLAFTGRARAVGREGVMLALKIGVVIWMVNYAAFASLFPTVLYTVEWLVGLVTSYTNITYLGSSCPYSPFIWNRIDCVINLIVGGVTPGGTVFTGMIGLLSVMFFSSGVGVGIMIFLFGIMLTALKSFFHAMYILISAYIGIALLVLIAPLMIPLVLFKATQSRFEKWLRMLIGLMLQPIFLFTYLTIFLIALEVALFSGPYSVYRSIACNAVDAPGFTIGSYLWGSGAVGVRSGSSAILGLDLAQESSGFAGTPENTTARYSGPEGMVAVKTAANPATPFAPGTSVSVAVEVLAAQISVLAANCGGMNPLLYLVRLILSLFTTVAVIYIFSTMLQYIPYLGTLISSGDLFGLPNLMKNLQSDQFMKTKLFERLQHIQKGSG